MAASVIILYVKNKRGKEEKVESKAAPTAPCPNPTPNPKPIKHMNEISIIIYSVHLHMPYAVKVSYQ
jgi:hypothetical protein